MVLVFHLPLLVQQHLELAVVVVLDCQAAKVELVEMVAVELVMLLRVLQEQQTLVVEAVVVLLVELLVVQEWLL